MNSTASNDLDIVKELEKEIGRKLEPVGAKTIKKYGTVGYAIDEEERVTGLALDQLKFEAFPTSVFKLRNLQILSLCLNQLSSLPTGITQLQNLQSLNLNSNKLSSLPTGITQLQNLRLLYLNHNQLSSLPTEITQLQNLQSLYLRSNQLSSLPIEITQLELRFSLEPFDTANAIHLHGNPLGTPPLEIIKKGRNAVIAYFRSLEGKKRPLNEVKILLVGDGSVGKTSLVKSLLGEKFNPNESQTHGINIRKWRVAENERIILGHFWDFGGQEIMHATHQFFLSKRSVYILVLDGRKDEKTDYWLKTIESFGGDSAVLVVLNKIDENPGFDVNRRFLREKYPGIRGFYPVSCAKKTGIEEFRGALQKTLGKVEILETVWAESWFNVKQDLEEMNEHFISFDHYTDLCETKGVRDKTGQDTLVGFLNDLGVVVHFQDFELRDVYVLEPKWVTEGVYKIINSEELAQARGTLDLRQLSDILKPRKDYPRSRHRYIIDLMKKFELCFEIDKETVLVPDLLEVQEPAFEFDDGNALRFRIDYDFLPRSVMPRFIVKLHKDIHAGLRWRTGVVLRSETFESTAVVKCDHDTSRIYIHVSGPRRRDYFAALLYFFRDINDSFEKLGFMERVPVPDDPSVAPAYETLLLHERSGLEDIIPDGARQPYRVKELLGTVQTEKPKDEQILEVSQEILHKMEEDKEVGLEDFVELKPNIAGVGVNLNAVLEWIRGYVRTRLRR